MTNEQINRAIAEAAGWRFVQNYRWTDPQGLAAFAWDMPDYCADLNAMHEAEKTLHPSQPTSMRHWLEALCKIRKLGNFWQAPARERAEAFLRVLDKWEATTEESLVNRVEVQK